MNTPCFPSRCPQISDAVEPTKYQFMNFSDMLIEASAEYKEPSIKVDVMLYNKLHFTKILKQLCTMDSLSKSSKISTL